MPASPLDPTDAAVDVMPEPAENRDPISGTRGAHPVGVGVGAAAAGVVGGVIGSAVPIVGTAIGVAVGTAVGAVIGGYAGKGAAETLFPTDEQDFWRAAHIDRPYFDRAEAFDFDQDYLAAYRFGYVSSYAYPSQMFDDVEPQLATAWTEANGTSRMHWDDARDAVRDAWARARARQADADRAMDEATPMS